MTNARSRREAKIRSARNPSSVYFSSNSSVCLSVCQTSSQQKTTCLLLLTLFFYVSSDIWKFTYDVDYFSCDTRLEYYKFRLQKWTYFLLLDKQDLAVRALIHGMSYFSRYRIKLNVISRSGFELAYCAIQLLRHEDSPDKKYSWTNKWTSRTTNNENRIFPFHLKHVPHSFDAAKDTLTILCRCLRSIPTDHKNKHGMFSMWHNSASDFEISGIIDYNFMAITPESTLTWSNGTC